MDDMEAIFLMVALLYIWFDTDAFAEYARFFHLKFLRYNDFFVSRNSELGQITAKTYPIFLANKYSNFFIALITCPICLIVWLNILLSVIVKDWPIVGFNTVITWIIYSGLVKFLRWANE